jgi:hypothetical protein
MSISTDQQKDTNVLEFLCRHLVALCVNFDFSDDPNSVRQEPRFTACAGTIICIQDMVYFLAAGHIVRGLDEAIRSNRVTIRSAVLADTFGWRRVSNHPIPFDLINAPRFFIDDEHEGLDFGLIALQANYVRLLAANGITALFKENWIHQPGLSFDGYLMLGLPSEFASDRVSSSGLATVSPTMFRVLRLDSSPEGTRNTQYPRFVGQLDRDLPLNSIDGMSGGPIFGFKFGPPMRYWVVALQSAWRRDVHVVFGCPLPVLASLVTEWTKRLP